LNREKTVTLSIREAIMIVAHRGNGRLLFELVVSLMMLLGFAQAALAQRKAIFLNQGWEFRQETGAAATDGKWYPAEVPGVVHTDLLRNKMIPDPFFRSNEAGLQWIENSSWEYRSTFEVTPEMLKRNHIDLVFEGLDGPAQVYLNGELLLTASNMFREWRVDTKPQLKQGANHLLVVFPAPIREATKVATGDFWRHQTQTPEKSYLRKAAYEYGWDWGPRFVLSGIWRPVKLDVWDEAKISNVHVRQRDISADLAHLVVESEITSAQKTSAKVTVTYERGDHKASVSRDVDLNPGVNHIDLPIDIAHPELWYPNGYGSQPLYAFRVNLQTGARVQDEQTVRTGLRSIVLRRDVDQWGRSFEFLVNGIPVFAKGADVIPFDSFPTRVTTADYRRVLESAKATNMNMVRHWGGGYYETDEFYSLCDELGIMIWQDFMFGNEWQPGTYAFKENVALEVEYQIKRLRDHPSIVLWCGNNETEASWEWHKDITSTLNQEATRRMWQDYLTLFSGVIARAVERYAPETPYWPSSPSADYEDVSDSYQSGDAHNWAVWHGMLPFQGYEKTTPRFMTEYGFQSFPELQTVESFTLPEDRTSILTPVMLAHQKNTSGNAKIREYMLRDYPEPKDFPSFLYASQVLQAEGIKVGTEHLRRNRPRNMGAIYWQLNDCWPVASWSSIDYYGRWKALHYYARRFYNDLLVSPHRENGGVAVYVVSDKTVPVTGDLRLRVMTFDGKMLVEKKENVEVTPLSSKIYMQLSAAELMTIREMDLTKVAVSTELAVSGGVVSSNLIYLAPTVEIHLPAVTLKTELSKAIDGYRLKVTSPVLARSVYISSDDADLEVSDNYFDVLPGQTVEIGVKTKASEEALRKGLKMISLVDAFNPDAVAKSAPRTAQADPNWVK
jgi:beta-mannosidase